MLICTFICYEIHRLVLKNCVPHVYLKNEKRKFARIIATFLIAKFLPNVVFSSYWVLDKRFSEFSKCRGIYFAKYYGGGGEMAAGKKMKTEAEGVGKKN